VGESSKVGESGKVGESSKVGESGKVGESSKVSEFGRAGVYVRDAGDEVDSAEDVDVTDDSEAMRARTVGVGVRILGGILGGETRRRQNYRCSLVALACLSLAGSGLFSILII
jgi:NAD(P)H-nitrite reductase large subunit